MYGVTGKADYFMLTRQENQLRSTSGKVYIFIKKLLAPCSPAKRVRISGSGSFKHHTVHAVRF